MEQPRPPQVQALRAAVGLQQRRPGQAAGATTGSDGPSWLPREEGWLGWSEPMRCRCYLQNPDLAMCESLRGHRSPSEGHRCPVGTSIEVI